MKRFIIIFLLFCSVPLLGQNAEGFRIIGNLGGTLGGKLFLVGSTEKGPARQASRSMVASSNRSGTSSRR